MHISIIFIYLLFSDYNAQERNDNITKKGHLILERVVESIEQNNNNFKNNYIPHEDYSNITDSYLLAQPQIQLSEYIKIPDEIIIYCYPFNEGEITDKCYNSLDANNASSLFLPLMSEVQLIKSPSYYKQIQELKNMKLHSNKRIKVYGVTYDNPNWNLIDEITKQYKQLFNGVLIEWVGTNACIWNVHEPTLNNLNNIITNAGDLYYFFREQDCELSMLKELTNGAYYNPNNEIDYSSTNVIKGQFPYFLKPIFSCFHGSEGPCYQAHKDHKEKACSNQQIYAWSPLDMLGNLLLYYRNDTCIGLKDHVLYSVV